MQPIVHTSREREFITYSEHWHTSKVLLMLGVESERGSYHQFLASIVFTAFTLEAFLNHMGEHLFSLWPEMEKLAPKAKLLLICEKLNIEVDFSRLPWQIIPKLFGVRNKIAHGKNELLKDERELGAESYDELLGKMLRTKWQEYGTQENAQDARDQVAALCEIIWDKSDFPHHGLFQFGLQSHAAYVKS